MPRISTDRTYALSPTESRLRYQRSFLLHEVTENVFDVHDRQRWVYTGVRLPVADQARLLSEGLAADITDIGTFPRVDEQVLPVSCTTCERFATDVTVVGPVAGVRHHVLLQAMVLCERFPAFLAYEALSPLVLQEYVLVEVLLGDHAPLTDLALVLGLEMGPLLVHVQGVAIRASLPADVADYGPLFVLEPDVQSHVPLHLELLATVLAVVLVIGRVLAFQVFLQPPPILALELAHVAGVLLWLCGVTVAAFPFAESLGRVLSADVRVQSGLVRALVVAEVAGVGQTVGVL